MENYFKDQNNFKNNENIASIKMIDTRKNSDIKYTIAIPTYNRGSLLMEALESALFQDINNNYEIIIVDNSDNEDTYNLIREVNSDKLAYYKNVENIGMFGNWNRCIELAQGKYITILNDDDLLSRSYLSYCDLYLNDSTDGLYFKHNMIYEGKFQKIIKRESYTFLRRILNLISRQKKKLTLFDFFLGNKSVGTLGILFKTEYLKRMGGYNPDHYPSSDYILHAHYCNKYNVFRINKKLNYYRVAENESAKQKTLKGWDDLDNDIRKFMIERMDMNKKLLLYINNLIQDNRVRALVNSWGYITDSEIRYTIKHAIIEKIISLKYFLNY